MRREVDPDVYCPQAALIDEETHLRTERRLARYRAKVEARKQRERSMLALQRQRRQLAWAAAGTLAAVALGLVWYKRRSIAKRRRRGGDGGLPRDLFLDEDDGFSGTDEELKQLFEEAAKVARAFPDGMLDQRDQLMLYGLYKQAREGDRHDDAPSKLNVVAGAKYDSWGKFKGLPQQFAMKKYCEVVYHFSHGGESAYSDAKADDNADVVYDDDKHADLDEDGCPIIDNNGGSDDLGMPTGMGIRPSTLLGKADGAPQNAVTECTTTPEERLRSAAMLNNAAKLKEIIGGDCNIDDADDVGQTALHFAADRGSTACLNLLIEAGANVNAVDCDGIGVLQTALSAGSDVEVLRSLLDAGADPDATDDDGDSARMWVSEEGSKDIVDLFESYPSR